MRRRIRDFAVWLLVLIAVLAGVAACTTTSGSFCAISHPVRLSQTAIDGLSDAEVASILAINKRGETLCHWKK